MPDLRKAMDRAQASGAAHRRRGVVARVDRLPPRRVGRRRHGLRIAEGPDGAAGSRLLRGLEEGAGRVEDGEAAASLLRLGRDASGRTRRVSSRTRPARTCSTASAKRSTCWKKRARRTCSRVTRGTARRRARRSAAWGLEIVCEDPREYPNSMTAVLHARRLQRRRAARRSILEHFNMSLGVGLSKFAGKVFRIGHLGQLQRPDARRARLRRRDGPAARGRAAPRRRRARCDAVADASLGSSSLTEPAHAR